MNPPLFFYLLASEFEAGRRVSLEVALNLAHAAAAIDLDGETYEAIDRVSKVALGIQALRRNILNAKAGAS